MTNRWSWSIVGFILGLLIAIALISPWRTKPGPAEISRLKDCQRELGSNLRGSQTTDSLKEQISVCIARENGEDVLAESEIRRNAYKQQQGETTPLLWLVIIMTLSGVLLAGAQLMMTFRLVSEGRLSQFAKSGKLEVSPDKFTMTSSTVGVLVLAISLAFFYIFVHEIHEIRDQAPPAVKMLNELPTGDMRPDE